MILGLTIITAAILFIILSLYKAVSFAHMPLHARMELYPVPQEKGRHKYGGSYMEEVEWWHKPRQISRTSELIDMMKECCLSRNCLIIRDPCGGFPMHSMWVFIFYLHGRFYW